MRSGNAHERDQCDEGRDISKSKLIGHDVLPPDAGNRAYRNRQHFELKKISSVAINQRWQKLGDG
jgi:hypothetical protein